MQWNVTPYTHPNLKNSRWLPYSTVIYHLVVAEYDIYTSRPNHIPIFLPECKPHFEYLLKTEFPVWWVNHVCIPISCITEQRLYLDNRTQRTEPNGKMPLRNWNWLYTLSYNDQWTIAYSFLSLRYVYLHPATLIFHLVHHITGQQEGSGMTNPFTHCLVTN